MSEKITKPKRKPGKIERYPTEVEIVPLPEGYQAEDVLTKIVRRAMLEVQAKEREELTQRRYA